jgi:isopenicillin-N epimerase
VTFGRPLRSLWPLDPELTYLNHGTVGVTPWAVLRAQEALRVAIERNPARFVLRELSGLNPSTAQPLLRQAAQEVATFLGTSGEHLVFVDNATTGINAVLISAPLPEGSEILISETTYGAVRLAAQAIAELRGLRVRSFAWPWPPSPEGYLTALAKALSPQTRLLILDHIVSETALWLPLGPLAELAHQRGAWVLVDGAHAPGAIPLAIEALGVDWYVGNLHKWAMAPRGVGFLWVHPDHQDSTRHPVFSWGTPGPFHLRFDWVGTRDPSPFLTAPEGIRFLQELGLAELWDYTHRLAWDAAQMLSDRWGLAFDVPRSMVGAMVRVPLPLEGDEQAAQALEAELLARQIEVPIRSTLNRLWARISCAPYVGPEDLETLAQAVETLRQKFGGSARRPG